MAAKMGTPEICSTSSSDLQLSSRDSSRKANPTPSNIPTINASIPLRAGLGLTGAKGNVAGSHTVAVTAFMRGLTSETFFVNAWPRALAINCARFGSVSL